MTVAMNTDVSNWYSNHYRTANTRQNTREVELRFEG